MYWLFVLVIPFLCVGTGAGWIYLAATRPKQNAPVWFGVAWLAAVLIACYQQTRMPHRIEVTDTGLINFVGMFTQTTIAPQDIISVKAVSGGFVQVKHRGGKIRMLHQFTRFHEFLNELKRVNPNVEIRGC